MKIGRKIATAVKVLVTKRNVSVANATALVAILSPEKGTKNTKLCLIILNTGVYGLFQKKVKGGINTCIYPVIFLSFKKC